MASAIFDPQQSADTYYFRRSAKRKEANVPAFQCQKLI
jgi:hypothetical protein